MSSLGLPPQLVAMEDQDGAVSKPVAVISCIAMALLYVATLYAPTVLLRLPPPSSLNTFMIRRFLCALISTTLSLFLSSLILPVSSSYYFTMWSRCGLRNCHTCLVYVMHPSDHIVEYQSHSQIGKTGSLVPKFSLLKYGFLYETVAGCGLSSFVDLSNVCWLFIPQVSFVAGFFEAAHSFWWWPFPLIPVNMPCSGLMAGLSAILSNVWCGETMLWHPLLRSWCLGRA
ncbi:putative CAAX prenyl protease 2 [Sesbania bispinosa]|nr:putative CAAX prenyl protease 2 [Sesbania bispinosa]